MKITKYVGLLLGMVALSYPARAAITLNGQYGVAFNIDGTTPVAAGTLWAMVVDTNNDSLIAGMSLNSSLAQLSLSGQAGQDLIATTFGGKSFTLGTNFGTDTVFAMGGFNPAALSVAGSASTAVTGLTLGINGLATGLNYGFFFFPGVIYTAAGTYAVGSAVGGVNKSTADIGAGTDGMVIPSDGFTVFQGASTDAGGDLGGSVPNSSFTAVTLVPEPSAALLGALGVLGLLRRRRI